MRPDWYWTACQTSVPHCMICISQLALESMEVQCQHNKHLCSSECSQKCILAVSHALYQAVRVGSKQNVDHLAFQHNLYNTHECSRGTHTKTIKIHCRSKTSLTHLPIEYQPMRLPQTLPQSNPAADTQAARALELSGSVGQPPL